jgi:hypothetical protein
VSEVIFQPPSNPGRYRDCGNCGTLIDGGARICPACVQIVASRHGPPYDELIERSGRSIEDCRRALSLADGDLEAALELLAEGVEAVEGDWRK